MNNLHGSSLSRAFESLGCPLFARQYGPFSIGGTQTHASYGPSPFLQVCQSITVISASATFELWTRSIGIDRKSDLPYGEMFPSDEYFWPARPAIIAEMRYRRTDRSSQCRREPIPVLIAAVILIIELGLWKYSNHSGKVVHGYYAINISKLANPVIA